MKNVRPISDLLTISEACSILKCHPNTLRYWDKIGILKAIRFGKRGDRRYKREDILTLVEKSLPKSSTTEVQNTDFFKSELSQSLERIGHFQFITNELSKALTSQQVADVIIKQTTLAFNAQSGLITLLHNENELLKIVHSVGFKKRELKPWDDLPITAPIHLTDAVKTGNSIFIETIDEGKIRYPLTAKLAEASNIKSFAAAPLTVENHIIGVLCISFAEPQKFSEADRLFLQAIAKQCAQALDRTRKEDALRIIQNRLEIAQQGGRIGTWDWTADGSLFWSKTMWEIYGYKPREVYPQNSFWEKHIHPKDALDEYIYGQLNL